MVNSDFMIYGFIFVGSLKTQAHWINSINNF